MAGARIHMQMAMDRLSGESDFSVNAREALLLMIHAIDGMERRNVSRLEPFLNYERTSWV